MMMLGTALAVLLAFGDVAWDDSNVAGLVQYIERVDSHGLQPARYSLDALRAARAGPARDALARETFLLLASHLSEGVVDPQFARPRWCIDPRQDLDALLNVALEEHAVGETLERLAPRHVGYVRLRAALASYRELARSGGWNVVPPGRLLRLGDDDPLVLDVRRRLGVEGETLFDAPLDAAVRHFQSHHGITEDGIVGPETRREMNVSADDRADQIAANLERWRWMPSFLGDPYAIVNIAAFRLDVIEGEHTVLAMKTVVGKGYTKTPFFAAHITDVVANPWWNVPDSIADKELWPKQQQDQSYLAREHMIVTANGRIRQRPGPWNALGRLKFNMPNSYDVYLHDTPSKYLFERAYRAFSHGCIRLERPMDLALYLLGDQQQETLRDALDAGTERFIELQKPLPVYVLYWTAWVSDDGHMEFHRDHYRRDATLVSALSTSSR